MALSNKQIKSVLLGTIDKYLNGVVAWLNQGLPEGRHKILGGHWHIHRVHFYLFLKIGFYDIAEAERAVRARQSQHGSFAIIDPPTGKIFYSMKDYKKSKGEE